MTSIARHLKPREGVLSVARRSSRCLLRFEHCADSHHSCRAPTPLPVRIPIRREGFHSSCAPLHGVPVYVGHYLMPDKSANAKPSTRVRLPSDHPNNESRDRTAALERDRMNEATESILAHPTNEEIPAMKDPTRWNELRVVFHYWSRRWYLHHHAHASANQYHYGALKAQQILDWIMAHPQQRRILPLVLGPTNGGAAGILNLVEAYLTPLHTHPAKQRHKHDDKYHRNVLVTSLLRANTAVMDVLEGELIAKHQIPRDALVLASHLRLWWGHCVVMTSVTLSLEQRQSLPLFQNSTTDELTPEYCIEQMERLIREFEEGQQPASLSQDNADPMNRLYAYNIYLEALTYLASHQLDMREMAASKSLQMMDRMMQKNEKGDRFTYLHVMQTLAMTHSPHYAALAHKLMRDDLTIEFRDVRMWASVINAYTNASMPEEAQQVLNEMEQTIEYQRQQQEQRHHVSKGMEDDDLLDHDGGTPVPWANTVCYNTVLDAWAKSGTSDAASNAEELLQRMDALYRSGTNPHVKPDVISFSSVILAWGRSNHPLAAERCDALLRRLEESDDPSIRPDRICYNTVIQAHLENSALRRKDRFSAADKQASSVGEVNIQAVESILERMRCVAIETGDYSIAPCTITYNLLIDGHAKQCKPSSATRAEELLEMMQASSEKNGGHCRPDLVTYNIVLQAIANSGAEDAISRAEALISKLNELSDTKLQPNSITYNTLLDAMVHRGELQKAEALLQSMQKQYETGANTTVMNKSSFNIMINGYAKSRDRDGVEQAEALLQKLIEMSESTAQDGEVNIFKPDAFSFASIVDAHARRGKKGAVDRAQELLYQMEHVLNITPNRVFFNTMINLLAKSREPGAPQRAEAILNRMQELYKAGNLHVKPDDITFSTVINAWAVSSEPRKAEHAESILRHLAGAGSDNNTGVKPNMIMYSATINAWARTTDDPHHVDRAVQLLNDMEELYAAGNKYVKPNGHCYNAVLNSMAKSPTLINKAQRVHEFFERMMNTYKMNGNSGAKPTILTFSTIINACAFSNDDKLEAFNIARKALRTLIASPDLFGPPNNFVFGNFLLACSRLLPQNDSRRKIVMSSFQECCRLGQVDGLVLKNFIFASYRADAVEILGHDFSGTLEELPVEWRYNAMLRTRPSGNRQNEKHGAHNRSKQFSSLQA